MLTAQDVYNRCGEELRTYVDMFDISYDSNVEPIPIGALRRKLLNYQKTVGKAFRREAYPRTDSEYNFLTSQHLVDFIYGHIPRTDAPKISLLHGHGQRGFIENTLHDKIIKEMIRLYEKGNSRLHIKRKLKRFIKAKLITICGGEEFTSDKEKRNAKAITEKLMREHYNKIVSELVPWAAEIRKLLFLEAKQYASVRIAIIDLELQLRLTHRNSYLKCPEHVIAQTQEAFEALLTEPRIQETHIRNVFRCLGRMKGKVILSNDAKPLRRLISKLTQAFSFRWQQTQTLSNLWHAPKPVENAHVNVDRLEDFPALSRSR